jgi:hypothetical protein
VVGGSGRGRLWPDWSDAAPVTKRHGGFGLNLHAAG